MTIWRLKSQVTRLFVEKFVLHNIKETIKAQHYWNYVRRIHTGLVYFPYKRVAIWNVCLCHEVIMNSFMIWPEK